MFVRVPLVFIHFVNSAIPVCSVMFITGFTGGGGGGGAGRLPGKTIFQPALFCEGSTCCII